MRVLLSLLFVALFIGTTAAQQGIGYTARSLSSIERGLYSAEQVMKNKAKINLTADQEKAIRLAYNKQQTAYNDLKWDQMDLSQELKKEVEKDQVNIQTAKQKMQTLLEIEDKIKLLQFELMLTIKNTLTKEQREKLNKTRYAFPGAYSIERNSWTIDQDSEPTPAIIPSKM
ncbi:MAG: hypothetical protein AAFO07_26945 [Bacteroidota bacterium]